MTVACPDCRSVFRVDPAKVPATGVRARCSVCGGIILVSGGTAALRTPARTPVAAVAARPELAPGAPPAPMSATSGPSGLVSAPPFPTPGPVRIPTPAGSSTAGGAPLAAPFSTPRLSRPVEEATPGGQRLGAVTPRTATPSAAPGGVARVEPRLTPSPVAPVAAMPVAPTPVAPTPVAATPVAPTPVAPTPVAETPVAATPVAPTPVAPTPVAPTPVAVAPVAPTPVAVAPVAPTPVAVAPVAPTPVSRTPAIEPRPASEPPPVRRPINPFLKADPAQRAQRLARALVSDLVAYNPRKRDEGLAQGTLRQLFREDIKKSYEEYVEQVGRELAESTPHFQDALNDILAGGQRLF